MTSARCNTSIILRGDVSAHLHKLVNKVNGGVIGEVSRVALPSLVDLSELDAMSLYKFHQALKAGELSEVVVL